MAKGLWCKSPLDEWDGPTVDDSRKIVYYRVGVWTTLSAPVRLPDPALRGKAAGHSPTGD